MPFWIFLLAVWILVEWMLRLGDRQRNDQRFTNLINTLQRAEQDFRELKKLTARVAELEKRISCTPRRNTGLPSRFFSPDCFSSQTPSGFRGSGAMLSAPNGKRFFFARSRIWGRSPFSSDSGCRFRICGGLSHGPAPQWCSR